LRLLIAMLNRGAAPQSVEPAIFAVHAEAAAAGASGLRSAVSRLAAASGLTLRALSTRATDGGLVLLSAELLSDDGASEAIERLVEALSAEAPLTAVRWQVGGMSSATTGL
jgi:hypothetical protein